MRGRGLWRIHPLRLCPERPCGLWKACILSLRASTTASRFLQTRRLVLHGIAISSTASQPQLGFYSSSSSFRFPSNIKIRRTDIIAAAFYLDLHPGTGFSSRFLLVPRCGPRTPAADRQAGPTRPRNPTSKHHSFIDAHPGYSSSRSDQRRLVIPI